MPTTLTLAASLTRLAELREHGDDSGLLWGPLRPGNWLRVMHGPAFCLSCHKDMWQGDPKSACSCVYCDTCQGLSPVVTDHSGPGFCAGTVYVLDLLCGHQLVDDQSYLEV